MNDEIYAPLAVCRDEKSGDSLVKVTIVPDGRVASKAGTFLMDAEAWEAVDTAFRAHRTSLVIDYEHQTLADHPAPNGKAPAAGWMEALEYKPGTGIVALVKWTEPAKEMIRADEYRYLSPVLHVRRSDQRVMELHSAGLTNKPAIPAMERVAAKEGSEDKEKNSMDTITKWFRQAHQDAGENAESPDQLLGELKSALKAKGVEVPDGASREAILRLAIKQIEGDSAETPAEDTEVAASVRSALGLAEDADKKTVLQAMSGRVAATEYNAMKTRVEDLERANKQREANEHVEELIATGKILPNDREKLSWARKLAMSDPETLKMAMKDHPDLRPPLGRTTPPADTGTVGDEEQMINKALEEHKGNHKAALVALQTKLVREQTSAGLSTQAARAHCEGRYPRIFGTTE